MQPKNRPIQETPRTINNKYMHNDKLCGLDTFAKDCRDDDLASRYSTKPTMLYLHFIPHCSLSKNPIHALQRTLCVSTTDIESKASNSTNENNNSQSILYYQKSSYNLILSHKLHVFSIWIRWTQSRLHTWPRWTRLSRNIFHNNSHNKRSGGSTNTPTTAITTTRTATS